jgi:hypothetical protein
MEAAIAHFTFLALHANIKKIKISQWIQLSATLWTLLTSKFLQAPTILLTE